MKIENLRIKNVRGVSSVMMAPSKANFIAGPSGTGKSSVLDAIRFGLTGKLPKDGLHTGAAELSVEMRLEGVGEISRTQTDGKMKVRANGKVTTAKSVNEMIESAFGCSATTTGVMMSSEIIRKKDLAEYLLTEGFLKNDMTLSRLMELCPGLDISAQSELYELLPQEPMPVTLDDIDAAYGVVTASRTATKKMLAEAQALAKFDGMVPTREVRVIQEEIASLNQKLGKFEAASREYPKQKAAAERQKAMLADLEKQLTSLEGVTVVAPREKQSTEELLKKSNELVNQTERVIVSLQRDIDTMRKVLKALDAPVCPISEKLVCTTDKSIVRSELEEHVAAKEKELAESQRNLGQYKLDVERAQGAVKNLQERESLYQKKILLKKQYEETKAITYTVMEAPNPKTGEDLHRQIDALNHELLNAQNYARAKEQMERVAIFERKVQTLECLVKELSPNGGVRKQVLQHSLGVLETWCAEKMKVVLPKYEMFFDPDNDFEMMFKDATGQAISYEGLSAGERVRMTVVLLEMLSALNGFRILLIDDVNALDLDCFQLLLRLLEESADEYDHVFIAGLDNPGFVEAFQKLSLDNQVLEIH